jgi:uncharacterized membrane protein YidH (DUF202 family)
VPREKIEHLAARLAPDELERSGTPIGIRPVRTQQPRFFDQKEVEQVQSASPIVKLQQGPPAAAGGGGHVPTTWNSVTRDAKSNGYGLEIVESDGDDDAATGALAQSPVSPYSPAFPRPAGYGSIQHNRHMSNASIVSSASAIMGNRSVYEVAYFDRKGHTGAVHYVTQRKDPMTGFQAFVPDELTAKAGDVVVVRLFTDIEDVKLRNRKLKNEFATALTSASTVVEPKLAGNGALVITLGQIGTHTFAAEKNPDLFFTAHVAPPVDKVRAGMKYVGALVVVGIFAAVAVLATTLWYNSRSFFSFLMAQENVPTNNGIEQRMEELFFSRSFAWFVVATFTGAAGIILRVALVFRTERVHQFRRGYKPRIHTLARGGVGVVAAIVVALGLTSWSFVLHSNNGFTDFFTILSSGMDSMLYDAITTLQSVQELSADLPLVAPGAKIPQSATDLINQVSDVASGVKEWTGRGEDLVRGAFRLVALLRFVTLTITMFAAAVTYIGAYFGNASVTRSGVWAMWVGFALTSLALGTSGFLLGVAEEAYDLGNALQSKSATASSVEQTTGISDATVLRIVVDCSNGQLLSPKFLSDATDLLMAEWNAAAPNGYKLPINISFDNVEELDATIGYLSNELDLVQEKLEENPSIVPGGVDKFVMVIAPMIRAALTVARSALTISSCEFVRQDLRQALPLLYNNAIKPLRIQMALQIVLLAVLAFGSGACGLASFVLRRPYKRWYCWTTKRWFRFKYSLMVHRTVNAHIGAESKHLIRRLNGDFVLKAPPWCSLTSFLVATYLFHHVVSLSELFMAALLLVLNFSGSANSLPTLLLAAAYVLLVPAFLIPLEFRICASVPPVPRAPLRALSASLAVAALVMSFAYAEYAGSESARCVNEVKASRSAGFAYPFTENCSADRVFSLVEMSAYSAVVAAVCLLGFLSAVVLLVNLQRQFWPDRHRRTVEHAQLQAERSFVVHTDGAARLVSAASQESAQEHAVADRQRYRRSLRPPRLSMALLVLIVCVAAPFGIVFTVKAINGEDDSGGGAQQYLPYVLPSGGCNGHSRFCNYQVDELLWATSHNAMSSSADKFVAPNNFFALSDSLKAGYRAFMLDVYYNDSAPVNPFLENFGLASPTQSSSEGGRDRSQQDVADSLWLCHASCVLGHIPMVGVLNTIKAHLEANTGDVVVVMLEQYVSSADIIAVLNVTGLLEMTWIPQAKPGDWSFQWPTLRELGANNTRFIIFTDEIPGSARNPLPTYPQLQYQFDYVAETEYTVDEPTKFNCNIARGGGNWSGNEDQIIAEVKKMSQKVFLLNNFISNPLASPFEASEVNTVDFIATRYYSCATQWLLRYGAKPNFVAVDFWSQGDTLRAVDDINLGKAEN